MTHQLIAQSETTTKKGGKWEATIIINDGLYQGLITQDGCKRYESSRAHSEANVKRWLNNNIAKFNTLYEIKPPLSMVRYNSLKRKKKDVIEPTNKVEETTTQPAGEIKQAEPPKQTATEKRKPFTPYGLNGYLVDKNGNVRLMLDRKASAHTIVLNAEMFNALAEMVHKTQTQGERT